MFPLGSVLLPHAHLPLHIFEPRYRELTKACLAGDREFGVVLIERGSEVGGGDQRFVVGTVARIVQAVELPDGRWLLDAVGTERIRVVRWLPDDPYPTAVVEPLADPPAGPSAAEGRTAVERLLRQVLALQTELGFPAPSATQSLDPDPGRASFEAAILSPLGPIDAYAVLAAEGPDERLSRLQVLLEDLRDTLSRRMAEEG
jgi:Lon protease-like protein